MFQRMSWWLLGRKPHGLLNYLAQINYVIITRARICFFSMSFWDIIWSRGKKLCWLGLKGEAAMLILNALWWLCWRHIIIKQSSNWGQMIILFFLLMDNFNSENQIIGGDSPNVSLLNVLNVKYFIFCLTVRFSCEPAFLWQLCSRCYIQAHLFVGSFPLTWLGYVFIEKINNHSYIFNLQYRLSYSPYSLYNSLLW